MAPLIMAGNGAGTVFEIIAGGSEKVLYSFNNGTDGGTPIGTLVRDSAGDLYGTTFGGGAGLGTVFEITSAGQQKVLYSFLGKPDGQNPWAGVVRDAKGNLYGTTFTGGTNNMGTVFEITVKGVEKVLHSFTGSDGANPIGGLALDSKGNLYGTTYQGGGSADGGTVFKVTPKGVTTVLHTFAGGPDGASSLGSLLLDSKGNLYGTTEQGGAHGLGAVFRVTPGSKETVIYSFGNNTGDGADPNGGLVQDLKGNFYGTTYQGGATGSGTVFKLTAAGKETLLYNFTGLLDGGDPYLVNLVRDAKGNLYGTTLYGGTDNVGTVFKLTP